MKTFTVQYQKSATMVIYEVNDTLAQYAGQMEWSWSIDGHRRFLTFVLLRTEAGYGCGVFHWHDVETALTATLNQPITLGDVVVVNA